MRLTVKLSLALLPGILVVLAASEYLEMRRDIAAFNVDSRRDNLLIGSLVTQTIDAVWNIGGYDRAIEMLRQMQSGPTHRHHLRWLERGDRGSLTAKEYALLARGEPVWHELPEPAPGVL